MTSLISAPALFALLKQRSVVLLEAGLRSPVAGVAPTEAKCIASSMYIDLDGEYSDSTSTFPHMMLPVKEFAEKLRLLGIDSDNIVIVYDRLGVYSSARLWYMLKSVGCENVLVVDGGLPSWIEAGLPTVTDYARANGKGRFEASPNEYAWADAERVQRGLSDPQTAVIDARSAARFSGDAPEPRAGLRRGHMPHAVNLPFTEVLEGGLMAPRAKLREIFLKTIGPRRKLIFTCGSGVTACIPALAAHEIGYAQISVYDGSWSEWGSREDLPVV